MIADTRTFTARWIFPVAGPPLPGGTITVRGPVIESVDPRGVRTPDEDLGNAAILPGMVNPHTHLDLSGARGLIPPSDPEHFTDWLRGVIAYRRSRSPEQVQADIASGLAECLEHGTTLIGDIAAEGASHRILAACPARATIFWELIGLDPERFEQGLERFRSAVEPIKQDDPTPQAERAQTWRWGLSPHAPYSANREKTLACLASGEAVAIHVAECPDEERLLERREGSFVPFLQELGIWNPCWFGASLGSFLAGFSRSRGPVLFVHCNYLSPDVRFTSGHSIVYCPRTHAAFRHPPHPFRDFLKQGARVCLGTDSLASNPDLDILAEARFVHSRHPDFPGAALLRMITLSGAEALGWANEAGSLEVGKSADFVAVPMPDLDAADPYHLLLADHHAPRRTFFRGEWRPGFL